MQNVKESVLLKFLCYILIPIMIFVLAISIIDVSITSQYGEMEGPEEYIETEEFGREYLLTLIYKVQDINEDKEEQRINRKNTNTSQTSEMTSESYLTASDTNTETSVDTSLEKESRNPFSHYNEIEDESYEYPVYYEVINYNSTMISQYINYIIIDKETGNMFTNIRSNNYPEEINKLKNEKTKWSYQDGKITTIINMINQESTKYMTSSA